MANCRDTAWKGVKALRDIFAMSGKFRPHARLRCALVTFESKTVYLKQSLLKRGEIASTHSQVSDPVQSSSVESCPLVLVPSPLDRFSVSSAAPFLI